MSGNHLAFLAGGGAAAAAIRAFDWSATELGPIERWPSALKTAVGLMISSSFPKAIVWGPGLITMHNDAFTPILGGKPPAIGRSFRDVWSEAWEIIGPIAEKAFGGESTFIENFPLVVNRFGYDEEAHFTFCYSPIRDEHGVVRGMMDTVVETTETVRAQRQIAAVNGELQHRMRNLVAMVSALAVQSFKGEPAAAEMLGVFQNRLRALGEAQALLTAENHPDATIGQLVEAVLAHRILEPQRVALSGPPVSLRGRQALSLSLALNELLTNAIKYGALSNEDGRVTIEWDRSNGHFFFRWLEKGGPPVEPPTRRGFGSTLIERFVATDFRGRARVQYLPHGIEYEIASSAAALDE
ncbi:sensor histidine kinase [Nitratireductor pacificus]|uniref:histidine kinase n=1 Tax=Nitratireductor pacificus pht-3B TaxID=391937 RepID=K2MZH3_9HYPH|nr:PAS domain-containing sensor histidine kinase [Nitratireductor pacificus]EKF17418.1 signal transduction histidine kinase [Nitratireductor pacificus pht-3B]